MGPLDIERDFEGPEVVILPSCSTVGRWWCGRRGSLDFQDVEVWHTRCAYYSVLATQVWQSESSIENVEVRTDGAASEGVNDRDGLSLTLVPGCEKRGVVVGVCHGCGVEASPAHCVAGRLAGWCGAAR